MVRSGNEISTAFPVILIIIIFAVGFHNMLKQLCTLAFRTNGASQAEAEEGEVKRLLHFLGTRETTKAVDGDWFL